MTDLNSADNPPHLHLSHFDTATPPPWSPWLGWCLAMFLVCVLIVICLPIFAG
jgi:hypothetical protein